MLRLVAQRLGPSLRCAEAQVGQNASRCFAASMARGGLLRQTLSRRYHFSTDVYEAPGANQNGYQQHNYFFQPMYTLPTSKLYVYWVWVFIIGVNMTFLPMHFLGFNTMPRRYNESADACQGWNIMCTQGSFLALLGTWYCRKTG